MKEYDDILSQLKKENFKLKLRIYFLEEGSTKGKENPEVLFKYEELKVTPHEAFIRRATIFEKTLGDFFNFSE